MPDHSRSPRFRPECVDFSAPKRTYAAYVPRPAPRRPLSVKCYDCRMRNVFCVKLQRELPGLEAPPWPGPLGQRIYENVSVEAWKMWEERMKMILNEYRLMPWQKEAQDLVTKHMEDFFFGESAALPPGYVPQQGKN